MEQSSGTHSYQLIELDAVNPLVANGNTHDFAVALYQWLLSRVRQRMGDALAGLVLEVIRAQYVGGPYPAIGVRTEKPGSEFRDVSAEIERIASELLTPSLVAFIRFAATTDRPWLDVASDIGLPLRWRQFGRENIKPGEASTTRCEKCDSPIRLDPDPELSGCSRSSCACGRYNALWPNQGV